MALALVHAIHIFHEENSAVEKWRLANENDSAADNVRNAVVAEHYTLLLRSASYFIDSGTRDRVLEAHRLGGSMVSFQPAIECDGCACRHTVTISPVEVLGFVAHDQAVTAYPEANVIPFPAAR